MEEDQVERIDVPIEKVGRRSINFKFPMAKRKHASLISIKINPILIQSVSKKTFTYSNDSWLSGVVNPSVRACVSNLRSSAETFVHTTLNLAAINSLAMSIFLSDRAIPISWLFIRLIRYEI